MHGLRYNWVALKKGRKSYLWIESRVQHFRPHKWAWHKMAAKQVAAKSVSHTVKFPPLMFSKPKNIRNLSNGIRKHPPPRERERDQLENTIEKDRFTSWSYEKLFDPDSTCTCVLKRWRFGGTAVLLPSIKNHILFCKPSAWKALSECSCSTNHARKSWYQMGIEGIL